MATKTNLVIEVPTFSRTKSSSADQELVARMAAQIGDGTWVTNGETYPEYKKAGNGAQVYSRAVAAKLGIAPHQVKTRVWGVDGDNIVTDRKAKATWRFAITRDLSRVKRARKQKVTAQ